MIASDYKFDRYEGPLISIIMNCYNGERYLRQAIESVLSQSYTNWEVIFWDNQSADNSANIYKSYHDPRFHYYYAEKHTVLYEARNYALQKCQGDLISFLDVDDWWFPEKLQIQVPLFNDPEVGMSCGNYILVNERKSNDISSRPEYDVLPTGNVLDDLFNNYFVHISSLVVRKQAIDKLAYCFDKRFNILGDFDFLIRLSVEWKMASVQLPISYYRWHQNNTGYKTDLQISDELHIWCEESKNNPLYISQKSFSKFERRAKLYDVLKLLYVGKKREAYRHIKNIPTTQKIKTLIAILLPTRLARKLIVKS
jgi:glycosyltransferase involved in cell wall biosynthesis